MIDLRSSLRDCAIHLRLNELKFGFQKVIKQSNKLVTEFVMQRHWQRDIKKRQCLPKVAVVWHSKLKKMEYPDFFGVAKFACTVSRKDY